MEVGEGVGSFEFDPYGGLLAFFDPGRPHAEEDALRGALELDEPAKRFLLLLAVPPCSDYPVPELDTLDDGVDNIDCSGLVGFRSRGFHRFTSKLEYQFSGEVDWQSGMKTQEPYWVQDSPR